MGAEIDVGAQHATQKTSPSAARDLPADSSLFTRSFCRLAACCNLHRRVPPVALSSKALSLLLSLSIFMTTGAASASAALPPRPFLGETIGLLLEASLSPSAFACRLAGIKNFFMRGDELEKLWGNLSTA